ncbi:GUN4 domain-containing protein [Candidatus Atelocyanobacterium thalassae]|uniref:Ycf53-like protein n=1 Tax=cyanobacterium endosymbiont of Braarudosphaera bigelowii TaxID=1285375 RepID=A0ABN6K1D2_9CHRO|nr:GUN4 domain-containing protein [Candidatus Atelocyanobacterium thalassa]BDA39947.1 Ycf53-like protein [cyanobacterium endosymbiont of Braarudosphaera bigelowii]
MTNENISTINNLDNNFSSSKLAHQFINGTSKEQFKLIPQLTSMGNSGWEILIDFLKLSDVNSLDLIQGEIYRELYKAKTPETELFIKNYFPNGLVSLDSQANIDYKLLSKSLLEENFQEADTLTRHILWELAGEGALERKWVYFTEVANFPVIDLHTINTLWWLYSGGKFGFSVQRKLWLSVGKDFNTLWRKIGWKKDNHWTQYPKEFTWNLNAPIGHLPLLNQLRGVRVANSIFLHPVWSEKNW